MNARRREDSIEKSNFESPYEQYEGKIIMPLAENDINTLYSVLVLDLPAYVIMRHWPKEPTQRAKLLSPHSRFVSAYLSISLHATLHLAMYLDLYANRGTLMPAMVNTQ